MLFNSHLFIFLFLPVVFIGFKVIGHYYSPGFSIAWLVVGCLFFYGWWEPVYLWLILASITFNYTVGQYVGAEFKNWRVNPKKLFLVLGITGNLGLLAYFKYAGFLVDIANHFTADTFAIEPIILPLAISFFTFQQITYLVDQYYGKVERHDFLFYVLFVTFFPQLIAGPIVHHSEIFSQLKNNRFYRINYSDLAKGIAIFAIGLFKKVVIADGMALKATPIFDAAAAGQSVEFVETWSAVIAYTFQIYFDFSGYSDMAIGLGLMFGITLPLNFNSPYKATNIIDFWRRWHMTLSRFFRDYIYIPLGGNDGSTARQVTNISITMLLGGLWHGAGWTFVLWGGLHGLYIGINHVWRKWRSAGASVETKAGKLEIIFYRSLTLFAVMVAWVFFRAEGMDSALSILSGMLGLNGITLNYTHLPYLNAVFPFGDWLAANGVRFSIIPNFSGLSVVAEFGLLLAVVWFFPNSQEIISLHRSRRLQTGPLAYVQRRWWTWRPSSAWGIAVAIVFLMSVYRLGKESEFLYFQF